MSSPSAHLPIVIFGTICLDKVLTLPCPITSDTKTFALSSISHTGGNGHNAWSHVLPIAATKRTQCILVSTIGDDEEGRIVQDECRGRVEKAVKDLDAKDLDAKDLDAKESAATESGAEDRLDALLLPVDASLDHLPRVVLSEAATFYMRKGQTVLVPNGPRSGMVRIVDAGGAFLGVGKVQEEGAIAPVRLLAQ